MPSKIKVQQYELVRDILMFIANSNHAVTIRELIDTTTDLARSNVIVLMKQLEEAGYVTKVKKIHGRGYTNFYLPTRFTKELYQAKAVIKSPAVKSHTVKTINLTDHTIFKTTYRI